MSDPTKKCHIYHLLQANPNALSHEACTPVRTRLDMLESTDEQILIQRRILLDTLDGAYICSNHHNILGFEYCNKYKSMCMHPKHTGGRRVKNTDKRNLRPMTNEELRYMLKFEDSFLPLGSKICRNCLGFTKVLSKEAKDQLDSFSTPAYQGQMLLMDSQSPSAPPYDLMMDTSQPPSPMALEVPDTPPPPYTPSSVLGFPGPASPTGSESSGSLFGSRMSSGDEYQPPTDYLAAEKKELLDKLIRLNNLYVPSPSVIETSWSRIGERRQLQIKHYLGNSIVAVLKTINGPEDDQLPTLWGAVKDGLHVDKLLPNKPVACGLLAEVIHSYNMSPSSLARKQILSLICNQYSYRYLAQFNHPAFKANVQEDKQDEDEEVLNTPDATGTSGLFFNPPLTPYFYHVSKLHHLRHQYGMAPLHQRQTFRYKVSLETIDHIISVLTSDMVTQQVAYGVTTSQHPTTKEKTKIAKVIRLLDNQRMKLLLKASLSDAGFKVPCDSFLDRILRICKATHSKQMCGVNYFVENANRGFDHLSEIVEKLKPKFTEEEYNNLKSLLGCTKVYLKTKYYDNLSSSTSIRSHCYLCLLSDESHPGFHASCSKSHDSKCPHCTAITDLFIIMERILEDQNLLSDFTPHEKDLMIYRFEQSRDSIREYQRFIVRMYTQNLLWRNIMEGKSSNTAFATSDWAMKFLPTKFRESSNEWFAKNGLSWHLTAIERVIEDKGKFYTQTDLYCSIVENDVRQDASTTCSILKEVLTQYKKNPENKSVNEVYLRSDQAACYKSSGNILAEYFMKDDIPGLKIRGHIFSASQAGKSKCDTYAAIIKNHIRRFIRSGKGHSVSNPTELANAVVANKGVSNVIVQLGKVEAIPGVKNPKQNIPQIKDLQTFIFEDKGIRCFKAGILGGMANGRVFEPKLTKVPSKYKCKLVTAENVDQRRTKEALKLGTPNLRSHIPFRKEGERDDLKGQDIEAADDENYEEIMAEATNDENISARREGDLYVCPIPGCDASFKYLNNYYKHELSNTCHQKRLQSSLGYAYVEYVNKYSGSRYEKSLTQTQRRHMPTYMGDVEPPQLCERFRNLLPIMDYPDVYKIGFGLPVKRRQTFYENDAKVYNYILAIFNRGEQPNTTKAKPEQTSDQMIWAKDSQGNFMFNRFQWLDPGQVSYLFAKFAKMKKEGKSATEITNTSQVEEAEEVGETQAYMRQLQNVQAELGTQDMTGLAEQEHPKVLQEVNVNICSLAQDFMRCKQRKRKTAAAIYTLPWKTVKTILNAIGQDQFRGTSRAKASELILTYINDNCHCNLE